MNSIKPDVVIWDLLWPDPVLVDQGMKLKRLRWFPFRISLSSFQQGITSKIRQWEFCVCWFKKDSGMFVRDGYAL